MTTTPTRWIAGGTLAIALVAGCTSNEKAGPTSPAPIETASTSTATPTATPTATSTVTTTVAPTTATATDGSTDQSGTVLCTPTVMRFAFARTTPERSVGGVRITATNGSRQPCVTQGYPGVALLRGSEQVRQAARDTSQQPRSVTVAPGESVGTTVLADESRPLAQCPYSDALLFTLPDNRDSTRLSAKVSTCSLRVTPMVRG